MLSTLKVKLYALLTYLVREYTIGSPNDTSFLFICKHKHCPDMDKSRFRKEK